MDDADQTTGAKLWVVLARAYSSLAGYVERCIAAQGLCLSDFMVLEVLLHKGPMTISGIGEKVLLANASMTSAIDRLTERGLVVRKNSEQDRRIRIVELTREGRKLISSLYRQHERDIEAVMDGLSDTERNLLRRGLKKIGLAAHAGGRPQSAARGGAASHAPGSHSKTA